MECCLLQTYQVRNVVHANQTNADFAALQDLLYLHGVKDDRVRNPRMLLRSTLLKRLLVRVAGAAFLFVISLPGSSFLTLPELFVA